MRGSQSHSFNSLLSQRVLSRAFYLFPSNHRKKLPSEIRDESQQQRYVSFSCVDNIVSKDGPRTPVHMAHVASIHILDDDFLLHLFYLYRPTIFDIEGSDYTHSAGGIGWECERWWFKLTRVCRRWRRLIFGSASFLGLCLVCTHGTPVADMLAHSPPFPLVIDYLGLWRRSGHHCGRRRDNPCT